MRSWSHCMLSLTNASSTIQHAPSSTNAFHIRGGCLNCYDSHWYVSLNISYRLVRMTFVCRQYRRFLVCLCGVRFFSYSYFSQPLGRLSGTRRHSKLRQLTRWWWRYEDDISCFAWKNGHLLASLFCLSLSFAASAVLKCLIMCTRAVHHHKTTKWDEKPDVFRRKSLTCFLFVNCSFLLNFYTLVSPISPCDCFLYTTWGRPASMFSRVIHHYIFDPYCHA